LMVLWPHGTWRIPTDSLAFWQQIPAVPIRIRYAVAEIWSFSWREPSYFSPKNCDLTPLLFCLQGFIRLMTPHISNDRYTFWLQNETFTCVFDTSHDKISQEFWTYPIFEPKHKLVQIVRRAFNEPMIIIHHRNPYTTGVTDAYRSPREIEYARRYSSSRENRF